MALRRLSAAVSLGVVVGLTLAGCSDEPVTGRGIAKAGVMPSEVEDISALLPAEYRDAGTLVVGTSADYPPNEFREGDAFVGFDVDLVAATAAVLGLRTDFRDTQFDTILPAVRDGEFDVGVSSFTDTAERQETVDFVDYFSAGTSWAQRTGDDVDPAAPCGRTVAVQRATVAADALAARSQQCRAERRPPLTPVAFDSSPLAIEAVLDGRAEAVVADAPVVTWAVQRSSGRLVGTGGFTRTAPFGWAVAKDAPALTAALVRALQHLIDNGDYAQIVTHWGVGDAGMLARATVNGKGS